MYCQDALPAVKGYGSRPPWLGIQAMDKYASYYNQLKNLKGL